MVTDPIVEQLHMQREECIERFQYDFDAFVRDLKSREAASQAPLLEPPLTESRRAADSLHSPVTREQQAEDVQRA